MKKFLLATSIFCATGLAMAAPQTPTTAKASTNTTTTTVSAPAPANTTTPSPAPSSNPFSKYIIPNAPNIDAKAYILVDANSGKIIAQKDANTRRPPASLTKLMSLYVVFKELAAGHINLSDKVLISKKAWQTGGSRMFVKAGNKVPVSDLIQGVIVASGNDATTALAEYVGGTEPVFVQMMDQQAKILGMNNTHYTDATGLPHPDHYSTPNDLSKLAVAVIKDFPQYYHYFDEKWFTWNGIRQPNRNRLLWRNDNVDGLKTGHTSAAGYCLITSAQQNGMRLVAVVMGTPTDMARANDSEALLKYGFRFFETQKIYSAEQTVTQARVWGGSDKTINVGVAKDLYITVPNGAYKDLKTVTNLNKDIQAPITKGQQLGTINITLNGQTIMSRPLVALQDDAKGGVFRRFFDWISQKF